MVEDDQCLLMHTHSYMDLPLTILATKIRKLSKTLEYFGFYRRGVLEELYQTFLRD